AYIGTAASVDEAARSIAGLSREMIQAAKETGNFDLAMSEAAKASGLERRLEYLRRQMDDAAGSARINAGIIIDILQTPINPNAESWADGFVSEAERIKEAAAMLKQPGWRGFQVDLFQDTGWLKEVKEGNTNALIEILKTFTGQDPEVQEQAARIEKELQDILSGSTLRAAAPDEKAAPAAKKSWMAWWEEITKVPQELFAGRGREAGSTAGALFVEGLEASLQAKMNVAAALGNTFDFAGALEKEQEEIQKILTGLFSIDTKNIDSAFTAAGEHVKKLIERFRSNDKALIQMGIEFPVEEVKEDVEEIKQEFLSFDEFFADWVSKGIQDFFPQLAEEGAGAFGKIAASMASVSFDGMLRGLEEVGRAFAENENAAAAFRDAMVGMLRQMLDMLPAMFLQAGLQLIIAGNWPLGLAFIAAAASSALIGGYVKGVITREEEEAAEAATANASGNAFDETFIVPYGRGGEFTNRIINSPTFFRHGGGLGLMGEAGPEAVVPLKRLPNGDLGVESPGGGTRVVVNIINNTGEPVTQEESETRDGGRQLDIIIGEIVGAQIAQGRHNNALEAQFEGLRKRGR
ncbi:MAG: hypothetical protein LBL20_02970, partial [Treponema sp.]|nr:hypothetical protein [Treponema sp.]